MRLTKKEIEILFNWCHLIRTFIPEKEDYIDKKDSTLMQKIENSFWKNKIQGK